MPLPIVIARALHFASGMLLLAIAAAPWLLAVSVGGGADAAWRRLAGWLRGLLAVHFISGAAWGWLVFSEMAGGNPWAPDWSLLAMGWTATAFGRLSLLRAGIALGLACVLWMERRSFPSPWRTVPFAAALLGSLAWAGHAAAGGGGGFVAADACHLLAAGIWPGGLLPLAFHLGLSRSGAEEESIRAVRRFSVISLVTVALLAVTGWINAWHLVGGFHALETTLYGRLLVVKLVLFAAMVGIGACNLLGLKPRLPEETALASLRRNVKIELALGMAVVLIVAVLGMSPPAATASRQDASAEIRPPHFAP